MLFILQGAVRHFFPIFFCVVVALHMSGELRRDFGVGRWACQNSAVVSPPGGGACEVETGRGNTPLHTPHPGRVCYKCGRSGGLNMGSIRR